MVSGRKEELPMAKQASTVQAYGPSRPAPVLLGIYKGYR